MIFDFQDKKYHALIKLGRATNERIIKQKLENLIQVVDSDQYKVGDIDCCILDKTSWKKHRKEIQQIRDAQDPLHVPVLMLVSANEMERLGRDILEQVDHLLSKPLKFNLLEARIRSLLRIRQRSLQSEHRKRELELQESVIQATIDGIAILNQEGEYIYMNPSHAHIYGYKSADELIGKTWRVLYDEKELERFDNEIMPEFEKTGHWRGETVGTMKDGSKVEVEISLSVGDADHFVCIVRDITKRKKMEKKLRSELSRFNQLFENDPAAICVADPNGSIQRINSAFESLFGYRQQEIEGKNINEVLTSSTDEWAEAREQLHLIKQEGNLQEETIRYDKEGHPVPVLFGGAEVLIDGESTDMFNIYTDISALKEAEQKNRELLDRERKLRSQAIESREKFKDMFELSPVAIALLEGREFRYTYINQAYKEMFAGKEMKGDALEDVFPEAREQGYIDLLQEVFDSGENYHAEEKEVWYKLPEADEYKTIYRNLEYVPLQDAQGETYGILITSIDVTDQVMYRSKLKNRLQEKTTLLEEIHHRVKNNLAIISGLLFLQTEQTEDPEVRNRLIESQNRIQSMALVHEQIYKQAESDADIDLSEYLPRLIETIENTNSSREIDVDVTVEADSVFLPLTKAIPTGLLTAELLMNAYKHAFTGRNEGKIVAKVKQREDKLSLSISDDGIGLPESFTLDSKGLGMQIIQNLTKQIDGELHYESSQSEGTTFTVTFPF